MKWIKRISIGLVLLVCGVIGIAYVYYQIPKKYDTEWLEESDLSEEQLYFPPSSLHWFKHDWYGQQLFAAQEEPIWNKNRDLEVFRFLWLRTFHKPVIIRVVINNEEGGALVGKVMSGKGGYEPGEIETLVERNLSHEEIQELHHLLSDCNFWRRNREKDFSISSLFIETIGLDGSQWILEGKKGTKYHFMDRWSPDEITYRNLCLTLVRFSGVEPGEIY